MLKINAIHEQDCIAGMAEITEGIVDMAFADPPFNIGYDYDVYDDKKETEHYLDWSRHWIKAVHRVLKPDGTFWLAIGDEYAAELKLMAQDAGFKCRSWVIWYYTFGVNCTKKFNRSHAHLFHFVKNPKKYTFNANDKQIRVPSARQLVYADGRANPDGRLPDDTWILRPQDVPDGFEANGDTWYFPRVAGTFKERAGFHGCQMPEQLLGRIIRCCSNPDDLILDPFSGSATTMVVAKKLGRQWVGFDLSADYVARGRARIEAAEVGALLNGAKNPVASAPATPATNAKQPHLSMREAFGRDSVRKLGELSHKPSRDSKSNMRRTVGALKSPEFVKGVVEAFRRTSNGFSTDHVLADDVLDVAFTQRCRQMGLPGTDADWNRALLRFRKAGKLSHIRSTRSTEFDWKLSDRFLFASEIAMRQMEDEGVSLDQVLCDSDLKSKFDEIARSFAPGFATFQYRWGALKIRKWARQKSRNAGKFDKERMPRSRELSKSIIAHLHHSPGLYLISRNESAVDSALYAGTTFDLRTRLTSIFDGTQLRDAWRLHSSRGHLFVRYLEFGCGLSGDNWESEFVPRQSQLIGQFRVPALNYEKLAYKKLAG